MFTLTLDLPNLPKGGDLEIDGLGTFQNGSSFEISDEQANAFSTKDSTLKTTTHEDGKLSNVIVPGRTLVEAFKDHPYITVVAKSNTSVKPSNVNSKDNEDKVGE